MARNMKTERNVQQHLEQGTLGKAEYSSANFVPEDGSAANGLEQHPLPPSETVRPGAHGYEQASIAENEVPIHPDLRSGDEPPSTSLYPPVPNMMAAPAPPPPDSVNLMSSPPNTSAGPSAMEIATDDGSEGRKAKRELSQSKRAAQNRAAQRAFRQRKEGYIKKLEQQVRESVEMENSLKQLQSENYSLREYIIHLQSRLLDAQGEFPQPPQNLNLAHPHQAQQHAAPSAPAHAPPRVANSSEPVSITDVTPGVGTPLAAVAQAVAGLTRGDHIMTDREPFPGAKTYIDKPSTTEDARAAEEISRQLRAEAAADSMPQAPM